MINRKCAQMSLCHKIMFPTCLSVGGNSAVQIELSFVNKARNNKLINVLFKHIHPKVLQNEHGS